MRACHETIYQAVYVQPRGELRRQVGNALRKGRAVRHSRSDGQSRRPRFREPMVMISERPRTDRGPCRTGTLGGRPDLRTSNKSAIGTLVERTTRYTVPLALPDGHDAEHVQRAIITKMGQLPAPLLQLLTWDQGAELALHRDITASLDMQVYFCDPHSPWQRGTNENTTDCCASTFQKGTDLSAYSQDYLDAVADELNDRPRKTLDWAKPSERIIELLNAMEYAQ